MDSEELSSLIILGIICVVSFIKSLRNDIRRKAAANPKHVTPRPKPVAAAATQRMPRPKRRPQAEPAQAMSFAEACEQIRKPAPEQFLSEEEGARVTLDDPKQQMQAAAEPERVMSREELRKAVIWSEILRPKF